MLLNTMRSGAMSILAKMMLSFVLFSAVIGLAMMDYNGMFRGGAHSDTVASVGGDKISVAAFDNRVRSVLSEKHLDPKLAYRMGYIDQILESEIMQKLLSRAAYDLGVQVSEELIAKQVNESLTPYITKDMDRKQAFKILLREKGMSEAQLSQALRLQTASHVLTNALQANTRILPEQEVLDLYRYQHEERTIKFAVLPNDAIKDYREPVDSILQPFYEASKERYAIPETRSFSLIALTHDSLKKADISEEELKKAYDEAKTSYDLPERRVVQQAVFQDEATAKTVAEKVKKGADFKGTTLETASKEAWLGEQTFTKSDMPSQLGVEAFAVEKGGVAGPVQSALGWHVVAVKDILAAKSQSFAEVKERIRKELLSTRSSDELYKVTGKMDDELASGTPLEDVAKDIGLTVKKFGPFRSDGSTPAGTPGFTAYRMDALTIMKNVFEVSEGESSSMIELKDGSFVAVRVDSITPKSYKPFAEVKADIRKTWIADQQSVLNKQKAQEAIQDIGAGKKTLEQVAQENHAQLQTQTLQRNDDPPPSLGQNAKDSLFNAEKGGVVSGPTPTGIVIGQVIGIKLISPDKISADDLKGLKKAALDASEQQYLMAYVDWLRTQYRVRIHSDVVKQMYGGNSDSADGSN